MAAAAWRSHHDNPATPPSHDEDKLTVAMAYVWQQGIDAGDAQPVTDCPAGEQFPVPDAPWPGLGLDDDSQSWGVLWSRLDDNIKAWSARPCGWSGSGSDTTSTARWRN